MSIYKSLLKFVPIFVVLVVLPRVASFLALLGNSPGELDMHDLIRWAFAAALGLGVIATSYFSQEVHPPEYEDEAPNPREKKRREKEAAYFAAVNNAVPVAKRALIVFAILDGTFNLGDALNGASTNGLFNPLVHGAALVALYVMITIIFGISPTLLSVVLTRVVAAVDKIPMELENKPVRNVLISEQPEQRSIPVEHRLPNGVRALPNSEQGFGGHNGHKTPNTRPANGEQSNRITEYLQAEYDRTGSVPSISQVIDALAEPKPSRSTVSVATNAWKQQAGVYADSDNRG